MHEVFKLVFLTKLQQAPMHGIGSTHTKNYNSNWSSRSKNIEITTGYSKGSHVHVTPALAPPPHRWSRMRFVVRIGWRTRQDFHWWFYRICVIPSSDGVPNCARQHDLSQSCLSVWSTISRICKFWYCMHP